MGLKVLNVEARDIHVVFEMSLSELRHVRDAIDAAHINYASEEDPKLALSVKYLTGDFFPFIDELVEDLEKNVTRPDRKRG